MPPAGFEPEAWDTKGQSASHLVTRHDRKEQAGSVRLSTGHLKTLRFFHGAKKFPVCTKYSNEETTPQHLIICVNLVCEDLLKRSICVLEVFEANELMNLV
ncbi:RNase H domain-containing protein [Caerostris darwini]|uniref:RNase H domain-containing protein n=1 Tax=Caerostris darwini TaxID=1538125 RepID=A0AAV4NPU3_9ARAC|nr:RNase H domain-containing protein [Caerostris darwini]